MARINNKKAVTIHVSNEIAAMIDHKRKEWGLRSRGEVIEHLLGWMVEPNSEQK
ncbi:ribbon-helix-helix protein, CopG family [Synechococcus sp. N19]|uniref:ribbon-helix-helix protein, CopG family n=1 Tax=Synechococcus sp. N19 TaxID=2575512 RepID=UPI000E0E784A|nr:ribbon-helix-helix protein, CopG family [Synechococcus sp. N19]